MTEQQQQQDNNKEKVKRYLILDTNTLSRASICRGGIKKANKKVAGEIVNYLKDVFSKSIEDWNIAISEITSYELVNESTAQEEVKIEQALDGIQKFVVDELVLRVAARLGCFYKEIGITSEQISFADKTIAATAFITNSIIYTTDMRDYPAPFFAEHTDLRKIFEYENKGCPVFLPTYFMVPQAQILNDFYDKRIMPLADKTQPAKATTVIDVKEEDIVSV